VAARLSLHLPDVHDRARAAFLGLAIGDALGATVEFMTPAEIRAAHGVHADMSGGGWLHLAPGRVTDDTEMSLAIARAVAARGGFELRPVAEALAAWLRGQPADVGNTCRRGLRRFILDGTLEGPPSAARSRAPTTARRRSRRAGSSASIAPSRRRSRCSRRASSRCRRSGAASRPRLIDRCRAGGRPKE